MGTIYDPQGIPQLSPTCKIYLLCDAVLLLDSLVLTSIFLEFPVSVVERTDLTSLQPSGNTVKVESVITDSPSDCAFLTRGRSLVGLAFDAQVHDVVSADSTVIDDDIPCPESNSIPLLDFKTFLAIRCPVGCSLGFTSSSSNLLGWHCARPRRSVGHIDVGHCSCEFEVECEVWKGGSSTRKREWWGNS